MSFTASTFRQIFQEFVDPGPYPDELLTFWSGLAETMLPADRWSTSLDYGVMLFVAHHLVLGDREQRAAELGGTPGAIVGPMASKTVDKASVSYDTKAITRENAGFWNSTSYGVRFFHLAMMMGAGPIQV